MNLLFIHLPKCGGTFISNHCRKHLIRRVGHVRISEQKRVGYKVFTAVRNPYSWYGSLYYYWKDRLASGLKYNPVTTLSRLPYHEFLDIVLHKNKYQQFLQKNNINRRTFTNLPRISRWQLGYPRIKLDVGFYTYTILFMLYSDKVFDMSLEEIEKHNDELLLIDHILRQEQLTADFNKLLKEYRYPTVVDKRVNTSKNDVTADNSKCKEEIKRQDRFLFKIFYPHL